MTYSLMIVQQGALPTLLEFPTHKAAEIAARELRVKSDSLQIINNTSGKVTNFSAVLEAEAREEEELSAARHQAHIDSLPESEIRRIYAQHKEELDRREERYRAGGWGRVHYGGDVFCLDPSVKRRMYEIAERDKQERKWVEAMEELCGTHREPVNTCSRVPLHNVPMCLPPGGGAILFDSSREAGVIRAANNSLVLFCLWGGLMLIAAAAVYAAG